MKNSAGDSLSYMRYGGLNLTLPGDRTNDYSSFIKNSTSFGEIEITDIDQQQEFFATTIRKENKEQQRVLCQKLKITKRF